MKTLKKTAAEVMVTGIETASPEETLLSIAERLVGDHISGMPVVENQQVVGMITKSDLVRVPVLLRALTGYASEELLASGPGGLDQQADLSQFHAQYGHLKVKDAMRHQLVTCPRDADLSEVANLMVQQHVHRVIVVDNEQPVGMISSLDVLAALAE